MGVFSKEHAQDGGGIKLAAQRASEFFSHLAAGSRALWANNLGEIEFDLAQQSTIRAPGFEAQG